MAAGGKPAKSVGVFCKPKDIKTGNNLIICLVCRVKMVENYPVVELFLRPRLVIMNNLFVNVIATTPMTGTFSKEYNDDTEKGTTLHLLHLFQTIEIYHRGSSVAFAFKCADNIVGGNRTGWNKLGWIVIPIKLNSRLKAPIRCQFPFLNAVGEESKFAGGAEFFLSEKNGAQKEEMLVIRDCRIISITSSNFGVGHTGDILFESCDMSEQFAASNVSERRELQHFTFSSFSSTLHKRRIRLLPKSDSLLRLIYLSMDEGVDFKRSQPFCIDGIAFCEGGVESTPICLEDSSESGYYAYRKLSSLNQSEVHIIPEFVLFKGGEHGNVFDEGRGTSLIHRDFLHYRIQWSRLEVTFVDTSKCDGNAHEDSTEGPNFVPDSNDSYRRVAYFILDRFTLDYQKLYKTDAKVDPTRSQCSAILNHVEVIDCTGSTERLCISS